MDVECKRLLARRDGRWGGGGRKGNTGEGTNRGGGKERGAEESTITGGNEKGMGRKTYDRELLVSRRNYYSHITLRGVNSVN